MPEKITQEIIVKADPQDAFNAWANFENFPKFMRYIKAVVMIDERTSHWVMEGPLGRRVEWDAETTTMEPFSRIAWNSKQLSDMKTSGQVTFSPLSHGETQITVTLHYDPPAGWAGDVIAELFGNPEGKLNADLRNFKAYIEGMPERTRRSD